MPVCINCSGKTINQEDWFPMRPSVRQPFFKAIANYYPEKPWYIRNYLSGILEDGNYNEAHFNQLANSIPRSVSNHFRTHPSSGIASNSNTFLDAHWPLDWINPAREN